MKISRRLRRGLFLQNLLFVALVLALAGVLGYLTYQYRVQWDVTANARHTLSPATREILAQLSGPVNITAYATLQDPRLGDIRRLIHDFVAPYQREKPDLTLAFVDPTEQPRLARDQGIETNGEMVIEYGKRSEHLTLLSEQALTNLLLRLARNRERLVMYLDGHGERKLDGIANHDLGDFGAQLRNKGFNIAPLNLAVAPEVPANVSVLVITQPRIELLEGEVDKVLRYLDRGGSLLWLVDPEPLRGLQPLAERLGLNLTPGVVVDPAAADLSAPSNWAIGTLYGKHPITRNFDLVTVFPLSRQIVADEDGEWHVTELIEVANRGWVESSPQDGEPTFDKNRDTPGPITVAATLNRSRDDRDQRVVVVGGGAFLSNAYAGNGGNMDLGINIVNWLAGDERLITIEPPRTVDSGLQLNRNSAFAITFGLLIAGPVLLLAAGALVWWRRRRR